MRYRCGLEGTSSTANAVPLLPFRLNGRGASLAGSLLPLPCGVTRHPKTVINRFEMAPPRRKAFVGAACALCAEKYASITVTLSGAERSRMGLICAEKPSGGSLTFPFGEGAEQREADEVLFKN